MLHARDPMAAPVYTSWQKRLHWTIAALTGLQYLALEGIGGPFGRALETGTAVYTIEVIGHMIVGVTVLILMIWRFALRRGGEIPPARGGPASAHRASATVHLVFYALLILMPLLGLGRGFSGSRRSAGRTRSGRLF